MAFAATKSTKEPRAFSIGPYKIEIYTYTAANTDTAGTITSTTLSTIEHAIVDGVIQTSVPSFAANVATLAFTDPGAGGAAGTIVLFGK